MSIAISFEVQDTGTKILRTVSQAIQPARIGPIIGRSANNTIREHLFGVNASRPNKLGGKRTNYYAQAARATQFQMQGDAVIVSINQIGIAQRYFGGKITPKTAKFLAIPASPIAHGKRPREFAGLVVLWSIKTHQPFALAVGARAYADGKRVKNISNKEGEILFWLKKSVTQAPDKTVLPYDEQIDARIDRDVASYLDRITQRAGGATS